MGSLSHDHNHHGHKHAHPHPHPKTFNKAFAIAVSLTLIYTIVEAVYAFHANSMSLMADAVHNLGDVLGLALAWLANWLLSFPARKRYSYGFKRTTIIAALINAFILVSTSAVIAYESIYKLLFYTEVSEHIVIIIGLIGVVVNAGTSLLFMSGAKDDINLKGAFLHLMADAVILLGVVCSAVLIYFTGWEWVDPIVGLVIVILVLWSTWGLLRDSVILIMDAVPHYIDYLGVKEYLQQLPGVTAIHDLHIWGLSTREVALTAHLIMPTQKLTDEDYHNINEKLLKEYKINHVTLQVETGSLEAPCVRLGTC